MALIIVPISIAALGFLGCKTLEHPCPQQSKRDDVHKHLGPRPRADCLLPTCFKCQKGWRMSEEKEGGFTFPSSTVWHSTSTV